MDATKQILAATLIIAAVFICGCTSPEAPKVYHVGIISGNDGFVNAADGFKAKMTELGYIEGQNIFYDFQKLSANPEGEKQAVAKFVADKVDLIFAFPTTPALAAKNATEGTSIPVVFAHVGVEGCNIVDSIRQPGGNITGVRFPGPDLIVKRFEFLMEIKPGVKQLYIPHQEGYPNAEPALTALRPVAASKGVTLIEFPVTSLSEIETDLQQRNKSADIGMDAIEVLPDELTGKTDCVAMLSSFASEHKIPYVGSSDKTLQSGSLLTYNSNIVEEGKLVGVIADKIFKGTPAGTIPVVTPEAYLKLNYKVAQELGLTVSESLLSRASEIIR